MPTEELMAQETAAPWMAAPPVIETDSDLPEWYRQFREDSWNRFLQAADPVRTEENWRFADLKKSRFSELLPAAKIEDEDAIRIRAEKMRVEGCAAHFVFANNRLIDFDTADLPEGAICMPLSEALKVHGDLVREHFMREERSLGGDKFLALHGAASLSGIFVYFPKGSVCERPIQVQHFVGGEQQVIFPHTLIVAEDNAKVSVFDMFRSAGENEKTLVVGVVDLIARNGGNLQYVSLQDESDVGPRHVQINSTRAGRDSQVKSAFVNLGASWVRNESINRMMEEGADCQIFSANLANGIQEYDQRTFQTHEAQHTTSDLLFKNALYDQSRTIFSGLIQVQPGAHHTDSFQTCRNMLGSDEAEANAMPGLEIDADQVKCSHGSTSGQISDEEIFYLQARGIPAEQARQIISLGFLNESISRLDGEELREFLFRRIEQKFGSLI